MSLFRRFELDNCVCFDCGLKHHIKSLLGNEVEIIKIQEQSLLLNNNKIIVDVWFNKIYISPIKTYYINKKDLKQSGDYKDLYIFEINKKPVLLRLNKLQYQKTKDEIPVHIRPLNGNNKNYYHYYAEYQKIPLHGYTTIIKNKFNIPSVDVNIDEIDKKHSFTEIYNEKETIENYKNELSLNNGIKDTLGIINNIKLIKNFEETKNSPISVGYVFDHKILPKDNINGHILIIPNRKTDLIFYYPNVSNVVYYDEICFIHKFIEFDKTNIH